MKSVLLIISLSFGGDSLLAMRVHVECNTKNLNVTYSDIFKAPTVEELSKNVKGKVSLSKTIKKCPQRPFYPASSAQKRMYLASNMYSNSTLYNITGGLLLDTVPNITKLQNTFDVLLSRHQILRTYFDIVNGNIVQKIADNLKLNITIQDVCTNNIEELFYIYNSNFDLNKAPLFNVILFRLPCGKAFMMLDIHHSIFDGTSLNNLIKELSNIYNGEDLPKLDIDYKDFAVWEEENLSNNYFNNSKEFWLNKFKTNIPILNLPTTYSRPLKKSFEGDTFNMSLSKELAERINNFSINHNVTSFMFMLACYYILLYNYTDNEDIIIGTPVSGRLYKELEPLLGMFLRI